MRDITPNIHQCLENGFRAHVQSILLLSISVISSNLDGANKKSANSSQFNSAIIIIITLEGKKL